ncbi:hypothetical protein [Moorena sp. SIO3A5]|nr:hypothetical protein [Moorena sp. SIO3A5]
MRSRSCSLFRSRTEHRILTRLSRQPSTYFTRLWFAFANGTWHLNKTQPSGITPEYYFTRF